MSNITTLAMVNEKTKIHSHVFKSNQVFDYKQWAVLYVGDLDIRIDGPEAYNNLVNELKRLSDHFNPVPVGPNDYAWIPEESDFPVSRENVGHNED